MNCVDFILKRYCISLELSFLWPTLRTENMNIVYMKPVKRKINVIKTYFIHFPNEHTHWKTNVVPSPPEMCVYCVGVWVCAHAPWWQPLDRSKAAMMNRHLALGSALAQWAVNLPLPLSACRMLNKVIWIFVILMCQNVKSPLVPDREKNVGYTQQYMIVVGKYSQKWAAK